MKRLLILFFVFLSCSLMAQTKKSQIVEDSIVSNVLWRATKKYAVYLPANYDQTKKYPVLYLLHGAWGTHKSWIDNGDIKNILDDAIAEGRCLPMIVVMPNAAGENKNFAGKNMGYFDFPGYGYESFFFEEFIPQIEKKYGGIGTKQSRAIAGLSMGGGGSVVYGQRHPEDFAVVCSFSGLLGMPSNGNFRPNKDLTKTFFNCAINTSPIEFLKNATKQQKENLRTIAWLVDCGDDDYLYEGNIDFYKAMLKAQIHVEYRMRNGAHNWRYWQQSIKDALPFISINLNK